MTKDMIEFIKDFEPGDDLKQCCSMKELIFQKELTLIKQMHQKNVCFLINGILKMLDLNLNHMFLMNVILDVSFQKQKELKY